MTTRWLAVLMVLALYTPAWADGPVVNQALCSGVWTAPQTNMDGSNLNDLKEYGIYMAGTLPALAALTAPSLVLAAAELDPPAGRTVTWNGCRLLATGQWYVQVDAVDTSGNRSPRTGVSPFVLADGVSPQTPGTPTFGP